MNSELKEKVRPIYEELKGYLDQFPPRDKESQILNNYFWTSIDNCIQELNNITGNNYDKFKLIVLQEDEGSTKFIENNEYRSKVNGLINNLKGTYFQDDNSFGSTPMVSVNQTQNLQVTMLLEINTLIDKQLFGENEKNLKPEEKSFLKKIKAALTSINTATELLGLIIKTAKDSGIDIHTLAKAFGWG